MILSIIILSFFIFFLIFEIYLKNKKGEGISWWIEKEIVRYYSNRIIYSLHKRSSLYLGPKYYAEKEDTNFKDKNGEKVFVSDLCEAKDRMGGKWLGIILKYKKSGQVVFHSNYDTRLNTTASSSLEIIKRRKNKLGD